MRINKDNNNSEIELIDSRNNNQCLKSLQNELVLNHGCIEGVEFILSKNFDERPSLDDISLLVIHCASLPFGEYNNNNLEKLFSGEITEDELVRLDLPPDFKVSVHLYINRHGKVVQFVPFDKRAWHAGRSEYQGKTECNHYSIGIELQGTVEEEFTDAQYKSLIRVSNCILNNYPLITKDRIVGHSDIAPTRKDDPGKKFDWEFYLSGLANYSP